MVVLKGAEAINLLVNNAVAIAPAVDPMKSVNRELHPIGTEGIAGASDLQHRLLEVGAVHKGMKIAVIKTPSS